MSNLINYAKDVIKIESDAIAAMADKLDDNFNKAIDAILNCKGRVIISGMGKSGLIGKKIVATFNSTGISSFFLHPAEALHGDLGLIRHDDIILLISKSGHLNEMELLIATAQRLNITLIAICGTIDSELYKRADIPLDCSVKQEACPNNLVPTSSSTAALVMGDALAVALLKSRNFSPEDFATLHPGGFLGKRLIMKVNEIYHTDNEIPIVRKNTSMKDMMLEMTTKRLGCVVLVNDNNIINGIFTDGDLRRLVETKDDFMSLTANDVIMTDPKTINDTTVLDAALALMEKHSISQLATVNKDGKLSGIIHLHDILKSKLV